MNQLSTSEGTSILTRSDVAALLTPDECRIAVEEAFRRYATGMAAAPGILGFHVEGGGFHIKVGQYANGKDEFFVAKTNANFPDNPRARGLPTIQGLVQVFDARTGVVIAIMDSIEITILRTAAATAVAAKYLARVDSSTATIAGCGNQGRAHVHALAAVRDIKTYHLWDIDHVAAERLAAELRSGVPADFLVATDLAHAVARSDVVVTCTPSTTVIVHAADVRPGSFVAGVGTDSEHKSELDPALLAASRVVTDVTVQCALIGDLHHALEQGAMRREDVHAELGEVVAGMKPGRTSDDETFVFDSTGMALQDAAAALVVVERAGRIGRGTRVSIGS